MTKGKSVVVAFVAVMCAGACLARPCGPGRHGGWHRPPPIHHGWHGGYHHHGGYWGRGGCHFWPGFVGGVVGGVVGTALTRPYYSETVVVQPAVRTCARLQWSSVSGANQRPVLQSAQSTTARTDQGRF